MTTTMSDAGASTQPGGGVPPLVLVTGPERLLADRAVASMLAAIRATDPDVEVVQVGGERYDPGSMTMHASPSLFGGAKVIIVEGLDTGGDGLIEEVVAYAATPAPDTTLIVMHRGDQRGKRAVDALKKAKARVLQAPAMKSDKDKSDFVMNEFRSAGRRITPGAVRALLEAVGKDLEELASACQQLIDDTEGVVDEDVVATYHGGKLEASGFKVADAAIAGRAGEALGLLRHALAGGLDPVPIVAVLASQLRQMVKVAGAGRAPSGQLASSLGMAPWQIDRSRRALNGWDLDGLGVAIQAVAAADFDVKGNGRDPEYAVERAVLQIVSARRGGR